MAEALTKAGRYQIVGELGRGSMGVVYKGFDPVIGRTVAIKTMLPEGLSPQEFEEYKTRFQREAMAAGILAHPNIITVYDFGEDNGVLYLAMEFLEGKSLESIVQEQTVLPIEAILPIYDQVCSALDHAHRNMIVHRDVKPANIMILQSGLVKVTDFGIAKMMSMGMTQAGQILGTPNYMSPEQVKGRQIDGRSDIFSLGVILYELVTGEKPFGGQNITTVIYKIINENPISPRELDASIPAGLSFVISKALAKNIDERYQTCRELSDDLRNFRTLAPAPVAIAAPAPKPTPPPMEIGGDVSQLLTQPPQPVAPQPPAASAPIAPLPKPQSAAPSGPPIAPLPKPQPAAPSAAPAAQLPQPKPQPKPATPKPVAPPVAAAIDETPIGSSIDEPVFTLPAPAKPATSQFVYVLGALLVLAILAGGSYFAFIRPHHQAAEVVTPPVAPAVQTSPAAVTPPPVAAPPVATSQPAPPVVGANNDHAHTSSPAAKGGQLVVSANVTGATISIDGKSDPSWVTPYTFADLPAGVHNVQISMDGYESSGQSVTVEAGQTANVTAALSAPKAELDINTKPSGIEILIDGKSYGPSPIRSILPAGQHTYTVMQPNGAPYQNTVTLNGGAIITKTLTLGVVASNGIVEVHSTPSGATVMADGSPVGGPTPTSVRLPVGNHTLIISMTGFRPIVQQVTVSENAKSTVNVSLESQ
jgi:eukaryotic-like serine/threonine-protein kinase